MPPRRERWYASPSAIAAYALLASALVASALGGLPSVLTVFLGMAGALIVLLAAWRREWEVPLHAVGATLLGVVAWFADDRIWWVAVLAVLNISGSFWIAITRGRRRLRESEFKSDQLASQLDRRISELFSLQELSYVLSESIQLDRIVDQVARYAGRAGDGFICTSGMMMAMAMNATMPPITTMIRGSSKLVSVVMRVSTSASYARLTFCSICSSCPLFSPTAIMWVTIGGK